MRKLDRFDVKILGALQDNGRIPLRELSEIVGLSQTPCHERIKRLEQENFIKSYLTDININRVLKVSVAYIKITLTSHQFEDFAAFEGTAEKYPEVLECYALGGGVDYILKLIMNNENECQQFIDMLMDREIGISEYSTHFVTKQVKQNSGFAIEQLMPE